MKIYKKIKKTKNNTSYVRSRVHRRVVRRPCGKNQVDRGARGRNCCRGGKDCLFLDKQYNCPRGSTRLVGSTWLMHVSTALLLHRRLLGSFLSTDFFGLYMGLCLLRPQRSLCTCYVFLFKIKIKNSIYK